jgi:putative inorganic carbon (hco3(-)) transporter
MSIDLPKKGLAWALIISTLAIFLISPFLSLPWGFTLLLLAIFYAFVVAFARPDWGLPLLILLRPCLDIFSNETLFTVQGKAVNFSALVAILTITLFAWLALQKGRELSKIPHFWLWLTFVGLAGLSITYSANPLTSISETLRLLSIAAMYAMGWWLANNQDGLVRLVRASIWSGLVPATLAVWQYWHGTGLTIPFEGIYNRIYGTFAHPNLLAYYLILPIVLSVFIFLTGRRKVANAFYLFPAIGFTAILALTYTRGAWLAFLGTLFIIGLARFRVFLVAMLATAAIAYLTILPINQRINDLTRPNPDSSVQWRINLWRDSLVLVKQQPFIGAGAGTASEQILRLRGEEAGSSDPHNDYLKITLENGLIGLAVYGLLLFGLFVSLIKTYLRCAQPRLKILILTVAAAFIAIFGMGLADNILRNTALQWTFWALAGAVLATSRQLAKK